MTSRTLRTLAVAFGLAAIGGLTSAAALCENTPVLTPLAEDTHSNHTLFSLKVGTNGTGSTEQDWLVVLEARSQRARIFPDPLADLRTGSSYGPGGFLAASRCGDDCFQPIQWRAQGWQPLGPPIEFDPGSSLHFTYDRAGTPWLVFHRLTAVKGILEATGYRWNGEAWTLRGSLSVEGVGSPGAGPDPRDSNAILSGTGRFHATAEPSYWLPALPVPADSPGGQLIALPAGAAAFLTFDGRIISTLDGSVWNLSRWTPWPSPLARSEVWTAGVDYSVDRPAGSGQDALRLLWYDDRQRARPALHLTRWRPRDGWLREATLDPRSTPGGSVEYVVGTHDGAWLLLGPCQASGSESWLGALYLKPGADAVAALEIPLVKGWSD